MTEKKRARTATASLWSIRFHKPPKSPSSIIISLAQNLKHCPCAGYLGHPFSKSMDLLIFLGAAAFTGEGMQEHFVCLHSSCRSMCRSFSPSVRDERAEVYFKRFKNTLTCITQSLAL